MQCTLDNFFIGYEEEIYKNLTRASRELNAFSVYRQDELPERWHIKHCKRTSDIWLVANHSYGFADAADLKGTVEQETSQPTSGITKVNTNSTQLRTLNCFRQPRLRLLRRTTTFFHSQRTIIQIQLHG